MVRDPAALSRLASLFGNPDFWRGALTARQTIVASADQEISPASEAMYRSEIIIAELKGESAVTVGRPQAMSKDEREGHDAAIARLQALVTLSEAVVIGEASLMASPEFNRWLAY